MTNSVVLSKIEEALLTGIIDAHNSYEAMSNGWWLQHAPEYFLTTSLAKKIFEYTRRTVYMDASPNRISSEDHGGNDIRETNDIRPDITVWDKKSKSIESCIEIKSKRNVEGVRADFERLNGLMSQNNLIKSAYVVVYCTHKKNKDDYKQELDRWNEGFNWNVLKEYYGVSDKEGWMWAAIIFKHHNSLV